MGSEDRSGSSLITLRESSPETGEIHCMGVKKAYHRRGIGTRLYLALEEYARKRYNYLYVKTVEEGRLLRPVVKSAIRAG